MTALDTNVLIRLLVRDDEAQAQAVYRRLRKGEESRELFYISLVVVLEVIWVLESAYEKSREEILRAIEELLAMPIMRFEREKVLRNVLNQGREKSIDLSDLLIASIARESGCETGITFDKKATRDGFFELLR